MPGTGNLAPPPFKVCFNFQKGCCYKEVCEYAHVRPGENPPMLPPPAIRSDAGVGAVAPGRFCRDFLNGNCNRISCKFPHVDPDSEGNPTLPPPVMSGPPPPFVRAPPPPPGLTGGPRSAQLPSPVVAAGAKREKWKCENIRCLFVNPADESPECCLDCGTPRPPTAYRAAPPATAPPYGAADRGSSSGQQQQNMWRCSAASCGNMNFEWRQVCNRCALPRPSSQQAGLRIVFVAG
jgi:hypothetical protein